MRAILKSLNSFALSPNGLEDYEPPDPRSFRLSIDAELGPDEGEGTDIFSFVVCTPDPQNLRSMGKGRQGHAWGRQVLFLQEWSYERVLEIVNETLSQSEGSDWTAVAARLNPYMKWEFEDYRS